MQTFDAQATLVEPSGLRDGLTTTIAREDIEEALRLDEPPALVLDVLQAGDVTSSVAVAWKRDELERLLRDATGEHVALTFDRAAIEQALDATSRRTDSARRRRSSPSRSRQRSASREPPPAPRCRRAAAARSPRSRCIPTRVTAASSIRRPA